MDESADSPLNRASVRLSDSCRLALLQKDEQNVSTQRGSSERRTGVLRGTGDTSGLVQMKTGEHVKRSERDNETEKGQRKDTHVDL
ncbi:hypothetical protein CesoFtcFv8_005506 [Champsocephalus esox]|uniref:Uncharacterized protein n=1 Tax=Champsocephalus esox TaxID=159716 RepID=A0AAN8H9T0_9TELE|nr:hypothetical protein CesoFtcFv8_005506 [Champsocephalus esox]